MTASPNLPTRLKKRHQRAGAAMLAALLSLSGLHQAAAQGTQMDIPNQSGTFSGNVRGFWFTAPVDFLITGLEVPTDASSGLQSIAVLRLNAPPPLYATTTNDFTTLFLTQNDAAPGVISASIVVHAGDILGILGQRDNVSSYASVGAGYASSIFGSSVTLARFGMQHFLTNTAPQDVWTESSNSSISRVLLFYSQLIDPRPELSATTSGLPMANAEGQALIAGSQTATSDINGHLFNLRAGGGEEEDSDGSLSASLDYGVVSGQGDGDPDAKSPMARKVLRSRQWEVFTTVNYGNVKLSPISSQSGVQIDSWATSVGIERHLSRGLTLGFAATFLQSTQTYTGGLGRVDLEGPALSTYASYVRKNFWGSLLYSFGDYNLGSFRNPGFGMPTAFGSTTAYTHSVQYNTGWNFRFQNNTLVTGPFAGIDYLHGSVDGYSETGGGIGALSFARQTFQSLVSRVGWSASKKLQTDWAAITPQFRLSYERQNLHNNGTSVQAINAPFTASGGAQHPGQDYMVVGTGVNFQFTPQLSLLLSYQTQIFRNNMESHFASVRIGYKF